MSQIAPATVDTTGLSDRAVALLRTTVPLAWGSLVALVLRQWPAVGHVLAAIGLDPTSQVVIAAVTAVVIAAWYAAWSWVQPRIPAQLSWLIRIVLGSAATPTYGVTLAPTTADGAAVITSLPDATPTPPATNLPSSPSTD